MCTAEKGSGTGYANAAIWKEWREREPKREGGKDNGEEKNARRAGKVEDRQRHDGQHCSAVVGGAWEKTHTRTHTHLSASISLQRHKHPPRRSCRTSTTVCFRAEEAAARSTSGCSPPLKSFCKVSFSTVGGLRRFPLRCSPDGFSAQA